MKIFPISLSFKSLHIFIFYLKTLYQFFSILGKIILGRCDSHMNESLLVCERYDNHIKEWLLDSEGSSCRMKEGSLGGEARGCKRFSHEGFGCLLGREGRGLPHEGKAIGWWRDEK